MAADRSEPTPYIGIGFEGPTLTAKNHELTGTNDAFC